MESKNLKIVYLHRYSLEYESHQFPITRRIIDLLIPKYRFIYFSMRGVEPNNIEVRKGIESKEIPFKVNNKKAYSKLIATFFYYMYLPFILLELRRLKPDFIICKEALPFIPLVIKTLNVPMMIDTSDWWWSITLGKNKFGRKIAKILESSEIKRWNGNKVIAIAHSKAEAEFLCKRGFSEDKIRIINAPLFGGVYHAIKTKKERESLGFSNKDFVVAVHGIIHPSKGYDQLLEWWKRISIDHNNWKLLIIGGSFGEKWCRDKIKELNLSQNVIMTGWLPDQETVNRYLNSADALLVTRRNTPENSGVIPSSLFHSLMISKPTIVTGLPGMSEIVQDKKNGFLFHPDDYNSFKETIEFVYNNPRKSNLIAKKGVLRAKRCFDPEIAAKKYVKLIEENLRYETYINL